MRRLTVSQDSFTTFVYPFLARSAAQDAGEWDVQIDLLRIFKDPALTEEVPLTPKEREDADGGQKVYRFRRLREDQATFLLLDEGWRLLKKRLEAQKTQVALAAAEDYDDLLKVVAEAPEVKVQEAKDAPEVPGEAKVED